MSSGHGPRAQRVHPHAAAGELDAQLARQREHAALRRGVGDLRRGGTHHRDERRGVDDRAAPGVEQVWDAVLAAQEDAAQVDLLHALPDLERGVEHRAVVGRVDAGVVEQHVDAAEAPVRLAVHGGDGLLVADIGHDRQVHAADVGQVDAHDPSALLGEAQRDIGADPAGGAGDDANLVLEATRHQPLSVA
jgi:hypothetical protein